MKTNNNKFILQSILSSHISQGCIDRHIFHWKKHGLDTVFYSSKDSWPQNTYGCELYKMGKSGHNGKHAIDKHVMFLRHMLSLGYEWYLINDYDSINFINPTEIIDEPNILGNVFYQDITEQSIWQSPMYIHPPYIIHKSIIDKILNLNLSANIEHGMFDRWLGMCCYKLGIEPMDFLEEGMGYARNTIEKNHLTEIEQTHIFIHGIKTKEILDEILNKRGELNNQISTQKVLYTGGTYDILHFGHMNFLKQCKLISDKVIVSLNTDEFVYQFKGAAPIMSYEERRKSLLHSNYVDDVVPNIYGQDSKPTILKVNPQIIAIGDDWAYKDYFKQMNFTLEWLEEQGIVLVYIPYTKGISTTEIKKRIQQA